jgi:hypothetical protein
MASYVCSRRPANPAFSVSTRGLGAGVGNGFCSRLFDDTFDVITVASSSMQSSADEHTLLGYDK